MHSKDKQTIHLMKSEIKVAKQLLDTLYRNDLTYKFDDCELTLEYSREHRPLGTLIEGLLRALRDGSITLITIPGFDEALANEFLRGLTSAISHNFHMSSFNENDLTILVNNKPETLAEIKRRIMGCFPNFPEPFVESLLTHNPATRFNHRELEISGERMRQVRNLLTVLALVGVSFSRTDKVLHATWSPCESDATYDKILDGIKNDTVYCNVFRGVSYIEGDELVEKLIDKYEDGIIITVFFGGDMLMVTKKEISLDVQIDVNYDLRTGPQFSCRLDKAITENDFYNKDESVDIRKVTNRFLDSLLRK